MNVQPGKTALMLGGGGARAAYHAGFLSRLAELEPALRFPILAGVSAGAINTACLASGAGTLAENALLLANFWKELSVARVFRTDWPGMGANMLRWFAQLVAGGARFAPDTRSLLDTTPLRAFLSGALALDGRRLRGLEENIRTGRLDAVAITTTNYATGVSTTWVESRELIWWVRPGRCGIPADLELDHILASCSLPLFFPAVQLEHSWHGDGGIRLVSPFSPAIQLGADRIVALSTRSNRPLSEADPIAPLHYPTTAGVIGLLLDAAFIDVLEQDALHLQRLNTLIASGPHEATHGLRRVELLLLRPSVDLAPMAREHEADLPRAFRFATRGLGTREAAHADFLATLIFSPPYVRAVMEIGARDAEARHEEVADFLMS